MHGNTLEQPAKNRRGQTRRSILVVDDDEALADVLAIRLSRQGFDTKTAGCGELGMTLARADKPSVILLDLKLPDIDGFDVCQSLVDDDETSDIPVIIISGLDQPDAIRRSRTAGCRYYLRKPYDPNALLALIRQVIDEAEGS